MKALVSKVKLLKKMERFYPEELRNYEEIFGDDIWIKQIKSYNQITY